MNLHENRHLYADIIDAASRPKEQGGLGILAPFIEKDYWITRALKLMCDADMSDKATFKGGTSLTKCYSIGNRFSEDVDVAISDAWTLSGNQLKSLIRKLSKAMSDGLTEIQKPATSKGSRYHKAYYAYSGIVNGNQAISINSGELLIEINSFANPYPREKRRISSFIYEFLSSNSATDIVDEYGLEPFDVFVLDKRRTFTEKIVSLFRASLAYEPMPEIKAKIRHFYDLHHLWKDDECRDYAQTERFNKEFKELIEHDRQQFTTPTGWQNHPLSDSPLLRDIETVWEMLQPVYKNELTGLAYTSIPEPHEIFQSVKDILEMFN